MQIKNKSERMKKMTGEQFLNKVRQIKEITDIHWSIEGDVLDPKEVKVVVIADDEEIELYYPKPGEDDFIQRVAISLLINKFLDQVGSDYKTHASKDITEAINYSRKQIQEKRKVENKMIKKFVNNEYAGKVKLDEVLRNVKVENMLDMLFMSDEGYQTVSILIEDQQGNKVNYLMRATTAEEIVAINQVIRSFKLGITVEFVNYRQYDLFIDYCMNLIKAKREVTA